ncbi:MAG: zinc metallopeptidase [Eubacterium sp.]|nr:zinc metallopeptidase [Eubacterium sp.]
MFFWDWTFILLIPGIIIAGIAQAQVSSAYKTYSRVATKNGMSGAEAARRLLDVNGLGNVHIEGIAGELTDHYDPRGKVMRLSGGVGGGRSVAAVGIAAHETGHAIQDKEGYWPLRFRNAIVPVCNIASNMAWPLFFIGLLFGASSVLGNWLMDLGILLFCVSLVFYIITLPVEFNASRRAVAALTQYQLISPSEEVGVKRVLRAAALTYVASALMAFLNLVRLLLLRNRN